MNMPSESFAWRQLQECAASQLSPQFADNVLRAARQSSAEPAAWFSRAWFVSAATATVCLAGLMFFHAQHIESASASHLAAWQEISAQTASLEPTP
jgi:hypothetical protein